MGDFTRLYNPESGWEYVGSSLAVPEGAVVIDDDAVPGPPIWRGHDYDPRAEDSDAPKTESQSGPPATKPKPKPGASGETQES